ncbi:carbohydrate ABC transporter permease [Cohnella phaseoli]|uniref:Multiple sugar transport system permease protein n=1 Tax=Cohnella phaseoli TaxID=456490 RepID=A0A3D9I6U1_9BACL|nr:sugar ABC transporter permease [Cohnella phaseoli]RED57462.1 multiple sugar transport system permease protein [Cohnella phaseoli]
MRKDVWTRGLLFAPGFLVYLIFMMIPIGMCVYYSLHDWDGLSPVYRLIGLDNFIAAFSDADFLRALRVTGVITIAGTLAINVLGLLFAVLLNKPGRMTNLYRSVFFFPLLLSAVVVGFLWKAILNYNGILNGVLEQLGLEKLEIFGIPSNAILTITILIVWQNLGGVIVLYLAGLQGIPNDLYEASKIDGAGRLQTFRSVTFPMLAPSMTMCMIFIFTTLAREYDRIAVLTNGGPGGATETAAFTIVKLGINTNRFSYAASLAVILMALVAFISIVMTLYLRKREERIL